MKATLALLLSLCLVLVDVSFGDDNGNTDTVVTPRAGDARSSRKCERLFPKLTNVFCVYKCRGIDLTVDNEPDGTPCRYVGFKGRCRNGVCITGRSSIFAPSVEPTEESPVPAEEIPDIVTYRPIAGSSDTMSAKYLIRP